MNEAYMNQIFAVLQQELKPDISELHLDVEKANFLGKWRVRKFFDLINKEHQRIVHEHSNLFDYQFFSYSLSGHRLITEMKFQPNYSYSGEILKRLLGRRSRPNSWNHGQPKFDQECVLKALLWRNIKMDPLCNDYSSEHFDQVIHDYQLKAARNLSSMIRRLVSYSCAVASYLDTLKLRVDGILKAKKRRRAGACLRLQLIHYAVQQPSNLHLLAAVFPHVFYFKCKRIGSKCHELDETLRDLCYLIEACQTLLKQLMCADIGNEGALYSEADQIVSTQTRQGEF